jgi:8-oxo-dGTP pyrophosphatase MutT (NUDIX family)
LTAKPAPLVAPPRLRQWRRVRKETVGTYRVFDVERLELEDGSGRSRGHAFNIGAGDWCNVIAITPRDELVLVWQYRFGTDAMGLEIPGGVIDAGESPEHAAVRELREETGYEVDRIELLLAVDPNPAMQGNRCFTFVAEGARLATATQFDPMEELETTLFPASRVPELLDSGQITHALVHGPLETYWRKRRAGR